MTLTVDPKTTMIWAQMPSAETGSLSFSAEISVEKLRIALFDEETLTVTCAFEMNDGTYHDSRVQFEVYPTRETLLAWSRKASGLGLNNRQSLPVTVTIPLSAIDGFYAPPTMHNERTPGAWRPRDYYQAAIERTSGYERITYSYYPSNDVQIQTTLHANSMGLLMALGSRGTRTGNGTVPGHVSHSRYEPYGPNVARIDTPTVSVAVRYAAGNASPSVVAPSTLGGYTPQPLPGTAESRIRVATPSSGVAMIEPPATQTPSKSTTEATGPLRLPTTTPTSGGSRGINTTPTGGTRSTSGGLETASGTQSTVVVTPTATPQATPLTRPTSATNDNSAARTDTVGSAIYRFGTSVPQSVVAPVVHHRPLPQTAIATPPAPAPLPPIPLGYDPKNDIMILPSADKTEFFDAPGTSAEIMGDPKLYPEDDVIEAPGAEVVDGVVGDVPVTQDNDYWLKARRGYQQELINEVLKRVQNGGDRGIVILPTGTGKTFSFTEAMWELHNLPQYRGKRILVIAHQDEIVRQNAKELRRRFGDAGVGVMSEGTIDPGTEVVSTTIQTLMAQAESFPWDEFGLVTVDEAHHYVSGNEWFDALRRLGFFAVDNQPVNQNGEKFLLGFTATPDRADGQSLSDVFGNDVLYTRDINYFIQNDYLRRPHCIRVDLQALRGDEPIKAREVWQQMTMEQKAEFLVALMTETPDLNRDGHLKRSIIYLSSRTEVLELERLLNEYGIKAVGILADTENRTEKLAGFRNGDYDVMLNIGVATEGFDAPGTEVVMLFGSDKSTRSRAVQMIGRALRPDSAHPDRTDAYIVDPWGLMDRHDITMNGEDAYFWRDGKMVRSAASTKSVSDHDNTTIPTGIDIIWGTHKIKNTIPKTENTFRPKLREHLTDEESITRTAYKANIDPDALRDWWFGNSVPKTIYEVKRLQDALGITGDSLMFAYQETVGGPKRAYLIQRLKDKAEELGRTPIVDDMGGDYPAPSVYSNAFGSWNQALKGAGFTVNVHRKSTTSWGEIYDSLHAAAAQYPKDHILTETEYATLARQDKSLIGIVTILGWAENKNWVGDFSTGHWEHTVRLQQTEEDDSLWAAFLRTAELPSKTVMVEIKPSWTQDQCLGFLKTAKAEQKVPKTLTRDDYDQALKRHSAEKWPNMETVWNVLAPGLPWKVKIALFELSLKGPKDYETLFREQQEAMAIFREAGATMKPGQRMFPATYDAWRKATNRESSTPEWQVLIERITGGVFSVHDAKVICGVN